MRSEHGSAEVKRIASTPRAGKVQSSSSIYGNKHMPSYWTTRRSKKPMRLGMRDSKKAAHLKQIEPGYFNPPAEHLIFVLGFNWLQVLATGM